MTRTGYLEDPACLPAQRMKWPPTLKLILAFIVGLLLLSPALLGLYWELLLPG